MSRYDTHGAFSYPAAPPPSPTPDQPRRRSGLGAAGLVLAILALAFGWIPIIGLAMLPPALLAVVLGIIGFVAAVVTGRTGKALPFIAATIGVFALLIPPAATVLFALSVTPWAYTVGMDQVQVEMEYDLKRQGVEPEQAERLSAEIGDALRSFAHPSQWRDGIAAAHRFGRICDDYRYRLVTLEEGDLEGRQQAAEAFRTDLSRLAERQGVDLDQEDLKLLADVFGREQIQRADNWRQRERRIQTQYLFDEGCGSCPVFDGCR